MRAVARLSRAEEAARRKAIAVECHASLHFFTRRMFKARKGFKWVDNWHHRVICDALERVFRGECTRLIINIPPRYSKTEIAVVNFIAWALGQCPDSEFIHTSYAAGLANANSAMARDVVQSVEYQEIFPNVVIRDDASAKGEWRTTEGGCVYATGSGGTVTGFGAGKMRDEFDEHGNPAPYKFGGAIIIDDPHKADEADSDVIRQGELDWFLNTLESRGNGRDRSTPIIVIMQRLHESDMSGFLIGGGNGEKWEQIVIPAIQNEGTENECALWPLKHTLESLQAMRKAKPYVFAGQYGQRPAPLDGGEFKPGQIETVDAVPVGTQFVRGWDLAGTKGGGDYTAGGLLGKMPDGRFIIAGMERAQESPDGVEALLRNTASSEPTVRIRLPQDPAQAGKRQAQSLVRMLARYSVVAKPISGDKVTRARPFAAQCNAGNVVMLRGPWNQALRDEMRTFPNGTNDDQIDALADAFDELTDNDLGLLDHYRREAEELQRLREAAAAPKDGAPKPPDGSGFLTIAGA